MGKVWEVKLNFVVAQILLAALGSLCRNWIFWIESSSSVGFQNKATIS